MLAANIESYWIVESEKQRYRRLEHDRKAHAELKNFKQREM